MTFIVIARPGALSALNFHGARPSINYLLIISTCNLQYAGEPSIEKSRRRIHDEHDGAIRPWNESPD